MYVKYIIHTKNINKLQNIYICGMGEDIITYESIKNLKNLKKIRIKYCQHDDRLNLTTAIKCKNV